MALACNTGPWEVETRGVQGHPWLRSEFKRPGESYEPLLPTNNNRDLKNVASMCPSCCIPGYRSEGNKSAMPNTFLRSLLYCGTIHNSQGLEPVQVPVNVHSYRRTHIKNTWHHAWCLANAKYTLAWCEVFFICSN